MKTETRKDEIIKTAANLFKEKGYSAVTMRDIAKAMGIKAASLYNHINSKQDILKGIIISLAEEFTIGMETIKASEVNTIVKLRINYEDNFRDTIRQGIIDDEILNENLEVLLFSILSTLRSLYMWIPNKESFNEVELSQSLSNVLINGINK